MNARLVGGQGIGLMANTVEMYRALPTFGSLFFYGCGLVVGDNMGGKACNTAGYVLSRPMALTEHLWNHGPAVLMNKTLGIPIILNQIQALVNGP
jgi:hypothetical protein